jgi:DNA polymerase I
MAPAKRKRLFLVDGMSQIYRAFYALPPLANSKSLPTNAVYGFTMMLRKLINEHKPDYLGVAFESAVPTFRHEAYEAYKATRQAMPDDLSLQLPYISRICKALRVPITSEPGYEADDIIGTLACQAEQVGLDVVIVTNDKDMSQLVTDHITLLRTERTGEMRVMDAKAVEAKLGVPPAQVVELLGLWGDTIDNIPGAPGIGEKGAKQIIQQFGTIEAAIGRAAEISRKTYRESLQNNADLIRQSRQLVTIDCNVPVKLDLESLVYEAPDRRSAYELFSELEFAQLKREFADAAQDSPTRNRPDVRYTRITSGAELDQVISSIKSAGKFSVAFAEQSGSVSGVAICTDAGAVSLIDLLAFDPKLEPMSALKKVLEDKKLRKSVHDWKSLDTTLDRYASEHVTNEQPSLFESTFASNSGCMTAFAPKIRIEGVDDDLLLAAYLLDPNRANYKIPELTREYLDLEPPETIDGFSASESQALQAAAVSFQLAPVLRKKVEERELKGVYCDIELPLVSILFEMERIGVRIDTEALDVAGREMEKELARLTENIYELAGQEFNINSPAQLGDVFEKLNFEVGRKTKTGKISTSVDVLEELAAKYELPKRIIEYRETSKLKGTYVDALPKLIDPRTGRIHTTLNQAVSATGRLSSTNPNLQNIPIRSEQGRRIRSAFVASPGFVIMSADYSQIELRVFAHITGDEAMTDAFSKGEDIHARTAREVFGATTKQQESEARRLAKIVNFAIPYVIGPFGLAQRTGLSRAEAKKVIENYYETYKAVRRYMEETPKQVRETGVVRTIFGRLRPIPDINNRNHNLRARAEREAINAPIQGTAADLVKMAMIRVHKRLLGEKLGGRMVLQVHDELLLEVPETEIEKTKALVRSEMESVYKLKVPLVVDIGVGNNWMEAKP